MQKFQIFIGNSSAVVEIIRRLLRRSRARFHIRIRNEVLRRNSVADAQYVLIILIVGHGLIAEFSERIQVESSSAERISDGAIAFRDSRRRFGDDFSGRVRSRSARRWRGIRRAADVGKPVKYVRAVRDDRAQHGISLQKKKITK